MSHERPQRTRQNLESALAGESMAHIKYRYFAKLCREAEICYATAVLVNAFDSWSEAEAPSPASEIALLKKNARTAMDLLAEAVKRVDASRSCRCRSALAGALVTLPADVPAPVRERLALLTEKYWK